MGDAPLPVALASLDERPCALASLPSWWCQPVLVTVVSATDGVYAEDLTKEARRQNGITLDSLAALRQLSAAQLAALEQCVVGTVSSIGVFSSKGCDGGAPALGILRDRVLVDRVLPETARGAHHGFTVRSDTAPSS